VCTKRLRSVSSVSFSKPSSSDATSSVVFARQWPSSSVTMSSFVFERRWIAPPVFVGEKSCVETGSSLFDAFRETRSVFVEGKSGASVSPASSPAGSAAALMRVIVLDVIVWRAGEDEACIGPSD